MFKNCSCGKGVDTNELHMVGVWDGRKLHICDKCGSSLIGDNWNDGKKVTFRLEEKKEPEFRAAKDA